MRTDVHNANHAVITTVEHRDGRPRQGVRDQGGRHAGRGAESDRHRSRSTATPTVTAPARPVDQTVSLAADGTAESPSFTATGDLCYTAAYSGDGNYPAATGAIEPLRVIHPATTLTIVGAPVTTVTPVTW